MDWWWSRWQQWKRDVNLQPKPPCGVVSASIGLRVARCAFVSNTAQYGGALASFDTVLLVTGSTFSDNVAMQLYGGAVFLLGASIFRIEDTTFLSNQAQNQPGGALYLELAVLGSFIERSSFEDNSAILGGAISMFNNSGSQAIRNCTFSDNISPGGALSSHCKGLSIHPQQCGKWRRGILSHGRLHLPSQHGSIWKRVR